MKMTVLFTQLLNIELPFTVSSVVYKDEESLPLGKKSVQIYISVDTGMEYRPNYDKRVMKHEYSDTQIYFNIHVIPKNRDCKVPKYQDKISKKVKTLEIPWSKSGSGFTLVPLL